jgi:hypothetical protein
VPQNGHATNLNHRFWAKRAFLANPGAKTACQNHCFHTLPLTQKEPIDGLFSQKK